MGCTESTYHKSSLNLSKDSTLDTCHNSPNKNLIIPDDKYNFDNFDTSELHIETQSYHFYDSLLKRIVSVPKLKPIGKSTILSRRKRQL